MTLGFVARAVVQALAIHLIVSTALSMAIAWLWRPVAARPAPVSVAARRLFLLRMTPSAAGLAAAALVLVAYGRWEAPLEVEGVGMVAIACAGAGLVLIGSALWRVIVAVRHTGRISRALAASARTRFPALPMAADVVESRFPVVALVGLVTPRLFIARRVIEACTPDEIEAVVAHEHAHADARDNLRRLAMTAAPDVMHALPAGRALQDEWTVAAELAADEWAAARTASGLALASALVKVARLATTPASPLSASALYRGEPITERVHRLLATTPPPVAVRWPRWARLLAPALLLSAALLLLPVLYAAAEQLLALGL